MATIELGGKQLDIDERVVAAMGSLLIDSAYKASEEMGLSNMRSMTIKYENEFIICRSIMVDKTEFILAILTKLPESDDVEKYFNQLLDWAVDNSDEEYSEYYFPETSLVVL